MFWMLPAIGALSGALIDKKNPLKGALLGGGLGMAGGAGLGASTGGLLGAAPAAGSQAGMLAAQEAGLGSSALGWGGATTGLQGAMNAAPGMITPALKAAQTASTVQSMMPQEKPVTPAPAFSSGGGNGSLQGMYQNLQNQRLAQKQYEDAMRARRRGLIG